MCVIGNGVVIDPVALVDEIEGLRKVGVKIGKNLLISDCAHLVLPYHRALDEQREQRKGQTPKSARPNAASVPPTATRPPAPVCASPI